MLDSEVFKQFQQQQQSAAKRGRPNDFQMAVAFPQIYLIQGKGKEQKLKYLPLFTVDVSSIFKGNYRKTGWDLTEYEFQPVVVNLMRLYGRLGGASRIIGCCVRDFEILGRHF
jgi:hypothetical protein